MTSSNEKRTVQLDMKLSRLSVDQSGDQWTVSGYATVFDNLNCYGFSISKGAYADLIAKGVQPKMYFNHLTWQDVPIGKWVDLAEDEVGLKVTGILTKGVRQAEDVYAALKAGTVDGLSVGIGFRSEAIEEQGDDTYKILKISSLEEISICTFPADGKARISETLSADDVDDAIEQIASIRDFEKVLRDAGRFSRRQSAALVSKAKTAWQREVERDADTKLAVKELDERLKKMSAKLS